MPAFLKHLLATDGFMPHGHCYLWDHGLVALHVTSDTLIGLAYVAISLTLAYLVSKTRREIPFEWVFLAFGGFIIACGGTHFMEVWTLWTPAYWLSGGVKAVTAAASVATAVVLPPLLPHVIATIHAARVSEERKLALEVAHKDLETLYERVKELDHLKTQLFANVSHELRTPLALILGPAGKLARDATLRDDQHRELQVIERNARALLKHVNDLLDISKLEAGRMEPAYVETDLAELVRRTASYFEGLAQERRVQFTVHEPSSLGAEVDVEKVERALLNVLSNAFKFAPDDGRVMCTLRAEGESAMIAVADSGPGVPAPMRRVIFERFRQADGGAARPWGGTGLGLAIAKDFVELQGGSIRVDEAPQGGALFTIRLPLRAPEAAPVRRSGSAAPSSDVVSQTIEELRSRPASPVMPAPSAAQSLVLVVEDNLEMNRFLVEALAPSYRTVSAFNGQEGLEKALALRPDLVLTDIMMPGMSGDQVVREMKARPELEDTPIVVLTAKADDELRVQLLRLGAQDYLTKPFSVEEMLARIENVICVKRAREILRRELASQSRNVEQLAIEAGLRKRELEAALKSLQESEGRFGRLSESNIIGIISGDHETIREANDAFLQMVGYSREDIEPGGLNSYAITPPEYHHLDACGRRELVERGHSTPFEKEYIRKDGSRVPVLIGAVRLDKDSRRWMCFVLDISERKRAERERADLLQRERAARAQAEEANRAKDDFLATVSHELRTPMTAILGWAQLLRTDDVDAPLLDEGLESIERNALAQAQLIEDLLDLSRIISGKLHLKREMVDLASLIDAAISTVRSAAETKHIRFERTFDAGLKPIQGDPDRLLQVISNLISNAVKFTPDSGRVSVRLEPADGMARLTITDTGDGISPEFLPYVFDRFRQGNSSTTRKHRGLGLGLAIVRDLVELHGGTIRVHSAGKGQGATFTLDLPAGDRESMAGRPTAENAAATAGPVRLRVELDGLRVLVVDDEKDAREYLARVLERCGARVTTAGSTAEAIRAMEQSPPDVLVTDIGMPVEDGYELTRRLHNIEQQHNRRIPAIAVTAYARSEDRERALSAGFDAYLSKPVKPADLAAAVRDAAKRRG